MRKKILVDGLTGKVCVCFWLTLACLIFLPDVALAAGVDTPMGDVLCTAADWFSGNTGSALEIISVISFGIFALLGKVSWSMVLIDAVGSVLLHSGGQVVTGLHVGASGC